MKALEVSLFDVLEFRRESQRKTSLGLILLHLCDREGRLTESENT